MRFRILNSTSIICVVFLLVIFFACKKQPAEVIRVIDIPVSTDTMQYETPFNEVPFPSDITMYEINERAFSFSGTFAGILPRLDSIKSLNVNVIWLMPINPIGSINTVNSPYCVKNYFEVNPEYGTLEDLRTLVREAHQRKMAVIIDWAANHTSWDNPWILNNPQWYVHNSGGTIIHPPGTNWMDVAELDFANPEMRLEMIKALKYWILQANLDGYRCDAADYVPFSFWKQALDSLKKIPNRKLILLAEGARPDHFAAGFQLNFAWNFFDKSVNVFKNNHSAVGLYPTHVSEYTGIPAGAHKLRFTSNHDKCAWDDTPLGFFGGKQGSMAAFVITAFMGGVPLIYNGQEVGCPVKLPFFSKYPINWTTNPDLTMQYKFLMHLRKIHPALRHGILESFPDIDIAAFRRKEAADEVLIIANTRNTFKTFMIPSTLQNSNWQEATNGTPVTLTASLNLGPFEYRILVK